MKPHHQELTRPQTQDHPKSLDGRVLGLAKNKKLKRSVPSITYQIADAADLAKIDKSFDILFEEALKEIDDLTTMDN